MQFDHSPNPVPNNDHMDRTGEQCRQEHALALLGLQSLNEPAASNRIAQALKSKDEPLCTAAVIVSSGIISRCLTEPNVNEAQQEWSRYLPAYLELLGVRFGEQLSLAQRSLRQQIETWAQQAPHPFINALIDSGTEHLGTPPFSSIVSRTALRELYEHLPPLVPELPAIIAPQIRKDGRPNQIVINALLKIGSPALPVMSGQLISPSPEQELLVATISFFGQSGLRFMLDFCRDASGVKLAAGLQCLRAFAGRVHRGHNDSLKRSELAAIESILRGPEATNIIEFAELICDGDSKLSGELLLFKRALAAM